MPDKPFTSVVLLDPESQEYKPTAHNLTASGAEELAKQFSGENRTAKILGQDERHRTSDPAKCGRCKKAAETASENDNTQAQTAEPVAS
jgi:hypothetical protein